jgi:hypothetical protein
MRKKRRFSEGDWFTVPLRRGARALGLVARVDKRGVSFLGYYFAPLGSDAYSMERLEQLTPRDAILIAASGSAGFTSNTWQVVASAPLWDRKRWPIPKFTRVDGVGRMHYETYGDDDVLLPIPADDAAVTSMIPTSAIESALFDAGAVEDYLWYRLRDRIIGG